MEQPRIVKRAWLGERGDITLLHMNILAQSLTGTDTQAFPHVTNPDLVFNPFRRNELTLLILIEHDPDIMCLAEVDDTQFSALQLLLSVISYTGVRMPKASADAEDGTAIFYRHNRLRFVELRGSVIRSGESQVMILGQFALLADPSREFIVAATHLKAKPGHERVRALQIAAVLREMAAMNASLPMFLLGDLNDVPGSMCIETIDDVLYSAYGQFYKVDDPAYYTTYKKRDVEVRRIIDYIYQSRHVICVGVAAIPPIEAFPERLPCAKYPSDHLALVASFEFLN